MPFEEACHEKYKIRFIHNLLLLSIDMSTSFTLYYIGTEKKMGGHQHEYQR